jgi:hypothetical protein
MLPEKVPCPAFRTRWDLIAGFAYPKSGHHFPADRSVPNEIPLATAGGTAEPGARSPPFPANRTIFYLPASRFNVSDPAVPRTIFLSFSASPSAPCR